MTLRARGRMVWDRTTPCPSCPYRKDAPLRLWDVREFLNLIAEDRNLFGSMFGCHEFRKRPASEHRPCAGWLLDQKARGLPNLRLRMALMDNPKAAACFEALSRKGLKLFRSIKSMVRANYPEVYR